MVVPLLQERALGLAPCSATGAPGEAAERLIHTTAPTAVAHGEEKTPPRTKAKCSRSQQDPCTHPIHLHPSPRNKEGPSALQTPRAC